MLFSSSICTCQLPPFEASASGFAMPFAFKLLSAEVSCSGVSGGLTPLLSRTFLLYQSAFPRWTFTGTDQTSPFALTMSLRSLGILLSHPSEFQMLVIGSILDAFTQLLISSCPAWTWKLSGGLPPCMRDASTAFAVDPAPPATAELVMVTLGYFFE